ncbi:MFS transporter [Ancylobacter dichloromethanicus]|uniref:MFS transporter n=1 Tax=Ancylobacter dichloromethanicus TaxID=518825 RepID=A0A9W6MZS9_9HYPH|nr:MFS transporter [Ancylobacter dichloromethanicus]MBS7554734.1 MFS transporter [Ancylobacter dichloromethanicus]GLK72340.1 MFS transporter [Ancylobacter dichloromethanicus]
MSRHGPLALLFATMYPQTVMSMMVLTPPVVAEQVTAAFGLPAETAGLYVAASYVFVAIGTLSTASVIPRIGPLRLSFACIAAGGCALALFGLGSFAFVLLATALMGLCYGPLTPAGQQAIANGEPIANLALFLSVRQTAVPLGGMLAGLIVPALVVRSDLETALFIVGGTVTLSGLLAGGLLGIVRHERREPRPVVRAGFLAPLRLMLGHRALLAMSFASTIYGALQLVVGSLLVVFVMRELGRDLVTAGMMLGISQAAAVCGRIGWGFIADRIGRLRGTLGAIGLGMAAACVMAWALGPDTPDWVIALVAFLLGGTTSGWNGVFLASLMQAVPASQAGFAASGALLFSYLGIVLGPPIFGGIAALAGFPIAFLLLGALALGGAALCLMPASTAR